MLRSEGRPPFARNAEDVAGLTSAAQRKPASSLVTTRACIPGAAVPALTAEPGRGFRGVRLAERFCLRNGQEGIWNAAALVCARFSPPTADLEIGPRCSDSGADKRVVAVFVIRSSPAPFCCRSRAPHAALSRTICCGSPQKWNSGSAVWPSTGEKLRDVDGQPPLSTSVLPAARCRQRRASPFSRRGRREECLRRCSSSWLLGKIRSDGEVQMVGKCAQTSWPHWMTRNNECLGFRCTEAGFHCMSPAVIRNLTHAGQLALD